MKSLENCNISYHVVIANSHKRNSSFIYFGTYLIYIIFSGCQETKGNGIVHFDHRQFIDVQFVDLYQYYVLQSVIFGEIFSKISVIITDLQWITSIIIFDG